MTARMLLSAYYPIPMHNNQHNHNVEDGNDEDDGNARSQPRALQAARAFHVQTHQDGGNRLVRATDSARLESYPRTPNGILTYFFVPEEEQSRGCRSNSMHGPILFFHLVHDERGRCRYKSRDARDAGWILGSPKTTSLQALSLHMHAEGPDEDARGGDAERPEKRRHGRHRIGKPAEEEEALREAHAGKEERTAKSRFEGDFGQGRPKRREGSRSIEKGIERRKGRRVRDAHEVARSARQEWSRMDRFEEGPIDVYIYKVEMHLCRGLRALLIAKR